MTKEEFEHYKRVKSFGNTRIIHFRYLGPTNFRNARVKLTDKWFGGSTTISYKHNFNTAASTAIDYLLRENWQVSGVNSDAGIILLEGWSDKRLGSKS